MIVFSDFKGASNALVKAMKFSFGSVSDEQIILKHFNVLLREHNQNKDAFDEFRSERM